MTANKKEIQRQIDAAKPDPAGKATKLYRIADADFLLQVGPTGAKSWGFRYTHRRKTRLKGLGSTHSVSYEEAKRAARKLRVMLDDGLDPLSERDLRLQKVASTESTSTLKMTFRQCAAEYIDARKADWSNEKHVKQWSASLEKYAYPHIGDMLIGDVDVTAILAVLTPLYKTLNETCVRLRGRCERIIGYAMVKSYRPPGPNPAAWGKFLSETFPRRSSVREVKHHAALPYQDIPAFMARLARGEHAGALMMRFMLLTAARTSEVRHATWGEINMSEALWVVPKEKMKARRAHRVPLSSAALTVLREILGWYTVTPEDSSFVFPGQKSGKPMSNGALLQLFDRMDLGHFTPHGTARSSFRQWCSAMTSYSREEAEASLAHQIESKTERAYQRDDLLLKRRGLMEDWGTYCTGAT